MAARTGTATLFRVVEKVKTPLSLAGLVVGVLYLVFTRVLAMKVFADVGRDHTFALLHDVLQYVFVLAIIAVALGVGSFVLAMVLKHRMAMRSSRVALVAARLDEGDSAYEQQVVDGERRIKPRKRVAGR